MPKMHPAPERFGPRMSLPAEVGTAAATLLAEDSGGINPVFILLGALPLVAGGAFFLVAASAYDIPVYPCIS